MPKHGKKYTEAAKLVDRSKNYDVAEAVALVRKTNCAKFDASVEASFALNIDTRHAEQQIRGAMVLPNGTGRSQRVLVIAEGPQAEQAKEAGADYVGSQDMIEKIQGGWFDFDVIIATPNMMGKLGRLGKLLGPKGLMPNPKTGTVTMDVAKAVNETKKGKVQYRADKEGNLACMIGKLSFTDKQLAENFQALYDQIMRVKPQTVKGIYIKNVTLSSTMGPSVKIVHD